MQSALGTSLRQVGFTDGGISRISCQFGCGASRCMRSGNWCVCPVTCHFVGAMWIHSTLFVAASMVVGWDGIHGEWAEKGIKLPALQEAGEGDQASLHCNPSHCK